MDQYVGEIRMFGGRFAPVGWQMCDGSLLPISQYETLFTLLGTTYGGDGVNTFAVPDLRGRVPLGVGKNPSGSNYVQGQQGGTESVTLLTNQLPAHSHVPMASSTATQNTPAGAVWGTSSLAEYGAPDSTSTQAMKADLITAAGGSQPHDNMMPFLTFSFIIATEGIFPQQS